MPMQIPRMMNNPIRWARYHAHENPALFYSIFVGALSPVFLFVVPQARRKLGYQSAESPPLTYPIPSGPRQIPRGYDD